MLYFAYGSNMDFIQMKERCPSARFVGVAMLRDYRLAFTRKSLKRNFGVADAVADAGHSIWGVVYKVDDRDIGGLDSSEGYSPRRGENAYRREERRVFLEGDSAKPLAVAVYFATPDSNPTLPNQAYKDQILAGARWWHLPEDYVRQGLETIEVVTE